MKSKKLDKQKKMSAPPRLNKFAFASDEQDVFEDYNDVGGDGRETDNESASSADEPNENGKRSPVPSPSARKMMLRNSSTGSEFPRSVVASPPRSISPNVANELEAFRQSISNPLGQHFTTVEEFYTDPQAAVEEAYEPPLPQQQVVNMDRVFAQLGTYIKKTLIDCKLAPCERPVISLQGPSGVGLRTAVRSFCSQLGQPERLQYRCNLITYRYHNQAETMQQTRFFVYLFALARQLAPCVVLIHRPVFRLQSNQAATRELLMRIYEAAMPWLEMHRGPKMPPFWLVFADMCAPGKVVSNWLFIDKMCVVNKMSTDQKQQYLKLKIRDRILLLLACEEDCEALMASYSAAIDRVILQNQDSFAEGVRDLNTYVVTLFSLPSNRISDEAILESLEQIDPHSALPNVEMEDFERAVGGILKAHEQDREGFYEQRQSRIAHDAAEKQHIINRFRHGS